MSRDIVVYGVNAALAVAKHRPQTIQRVLHHRDRSEALAPLLKATAALRRPYREVDTEDLVRVARSQHHEGVVVVIATRPPVMRLYEFLDRMPDDAVVLAMDAVGNPHNLGAILRSAAWFGAAVLFASEPGQALLSPSAMRIAEGGAETVPICTVPELAPALQFMREQGITILGADQNAEDSIFRVPLPRPLCLVMGNETHGLSRPVRNIAHRLVSIPGTGAVESLNVSVSAGILLAAAYQG